MLFIKQNKSLASVGFKPRLLITVLQFFIILFLFNANSTAQTPQPEKLVLNTPIISEIKGGETQSYFVSLEKDQTARVEIVQNGVDVSLTAVNPQGEKYIETESPSGFFGDDLILVTANETGEYQISIQPANPRARSGKYTILLKEIRPTVVEDFEINFAAGKITKTAEAADIARAKGTIEGQREALAKWREVFDLSKIKNDRIWEGIALNISGMIYESLGELQNAIDVYSQSLLIWQELGNRQYEASATNNLGIIYADLGEHEKAVSYYERAIAIQREIGNRRAVGIYLNNLAYSFMTAGDYPTAEKFFRQSLEIKLEDESERGRRSVAVTLNNLGNTLFLKGDKKNGLDYLQKSLDLRREIDHRWGVANSLLNLGKFQIEAGQETAGFDNLREANQRSNRLGDRTMESESYYHLAVAERRRGNIGAAIENISNGLDITEQIRGEFVGSQNRYKYTSTVQRFYELYIELLVSRFEKTDNKSDAMLALQISERSRSRSLLELLQEAKVKFRQSVDGGSLEKLKFLQDEVNNKYAARQNLLSGQSKPEQIAEIEAEIIRLNTEIQSLNTKIRRENPKYANLTDGKTVSVEEIQNLLDEKTVLLEYKLGEQRSFVWLVTKNSFEVFNLPSGKEIEEKARNFYNLIVADKKGEQGNLLEVSNDLSKILLPPAAATKINGKRLAIVADGVLQYTPFSALQTGGRVLADKNEIIILPSASVLARLREKPHQIKPNEKTIAIFADPIFDDEDSRISQTTKPQPQNMALGEVLRDFKFGEKLPRLLSSRQEARNISNLIAKNEASVNTDFDANLKNIQNAELSNYRILHFATHGLLNTTRPELSGLVFSLFDKNGNSQDGFLSLDDIYNLDLSSDLVVLSACQTALGKDVRGEGLIGVSRGFLYAGSQRIVASLWKVDDSATAEFMKRFYQNHLEKKMPASAALRQAKIEMKKIPRYKSPVYWSAFILLGDWK